MRFPEKDFDIDISEERINNGVTELMEVNTYYNSIERLNRMSSLHNSSENICRVVKETLEFGNAHLINPIYEGATVKTGVPLSKILIKDYLPPNA